MKNQRRSGMGNLGRAAVVAALACMIAGGLTAPVFGETTKVRNGLMVTGIVERVEGDLLTVDGSIYDTKGVPVRFSQGVAHVEKPFLYGKLVQILIYNRKIDSVLVRQTCI
jgi:hypothetical protein